MILIISYGLSYLFTFTSSILETTYETALKYQYINLYHFCASKEFHFKSPCDTTEDCVLIVQPGCRSSRDEELNNKKYTYNKNNEKDLKLKFSKTEETNNVK